MLAFTTETSSQIILPASDDNISPLNLTVHIRDKLNCVTEFSMEPIMVTQDKSLIDEFMNVVQNTNNKTSNHPIIRVLAGRDHNRVGQICIALSQELNKKNKQKWEITVLSTYSMNYFFHNLKTNF